MSGSEDVRRAYESSAADVNVVVLILLENGHLPRVLAKLGLSVGMRESLDAAVDSVGVAATALTRCRGGRVAIDSLSSAADLVVAARLVVSKLTSFSRLLNNKI